MTLTIANDDDAPSTPERIPRTSYELHPLVQICPFGRAGFSERESNEMSIDEKLDILQGCFGHEIHSFPPPPRLG